MLLDKSHRLLQLAPELRYVVPNGCQIGAEANDLLGYGCRLLDMLIGLPAEPQLLSMEGYSVGAVDRGRGPESDQRLFVGGELAVREDPFDLGPLEIQLRVGETREPAWDQPKAALDLLEDFLSFHVPNTRAGIWREEGRFYPACVPEALRWRAMRASNRA